MNTARLTPAFTLATLIAACIQAPPPPSTRPAADTTLDVDMQIPAVMACDALSGAGCSGAGEACVWSVEDDSSTCQVPRAALAHEAPCSPGLFECGGRQACAALAGEPTATCRTVCDPAGTVDACDALPGAHPNYVCVGLEDLSHGICLGVGVECDPTQDPCANDEVCSLRGGKTVCIAAGGGQLGDTCARNPCSKGLICVDLVGGAPPTCNLPCDLEAGVCPGRAEICTALNGFDFGICQLMNVQCDPLAGDCTSSRQCSFVGSALRCVEPGAAQIGDDCAAAACAVGGVCVPLVGESPRCFEPCDLQIPSCSNPSTECSSIGFDFGICV